MKKNGHPTLAPVQQKNNINNIRDDQNQNKKQNKK